jgi:hypothetical protein
MLRDLETELSMPAPRGHDRQQSGSATSRITSTSAFSSTRGIEQRRRRRSADDRDVGQLAQRAARLAGAVHRRRPRRSVPAGPTCAIKA